MREIKFRGKCKKTNNWVYGFLCITCTGKHFILTGQDEVIDECHDALNGGLFKTENYYEVVPETVGQYTGLKDRSAKMVWVGDIIQTDGGVSTGDIQFANGVFGAEWVKNKKSKIMVGGGYWGQLHNLRTLDDKHMDMQYDVIGNIHDHPEILKEKARSRNNN